MDWDRRHGAVDVRAPARRGATRRRSTAARGRRRSTLIAAGAALGRLPRGRGRGVRRGLHDGRASRRRARGLFRRARAFWPARRPGTLLVDMTTTEPTLAREITRRAPAPSGCDAVDAPVSGGDVGARNATLSIMVGGDDATVVDAVDAAVRDSWARTSSTRAAPGAGQHTKMCNQIVIAGTMIGVCESLLYGYKAGLDLEHDAAVDSQRRGRLLDAREPRAAGDRSATSSPASSSSTSSRTWGSRSPRRSG